MVLVHGAVRILNIVRFFTILLSANINLPFYEKIVTLFVIVITCGGTQNAMCSGADRGVHQRLYRS